MTFDRCIPFPKRLIRGPIVGGTYATSFSQYDEAGNVVKTIDPRGFATILSYQDNFGDGSNPDFGASGTNGATFAFATSTTNPLGHVVKTQYSYARGVPTGVKDPNGVISRSEYNDPYDRPTRVTAAYGLPEANKTEMTYPTAAANQTTVSKQLDATRWLAYKTTYDGFGRPVTASEAEDGNHASFASFTIFSTRSYDGLGRVIRSSNPFRSGDPQLFTTTAYDLAGRVVSVTTPDNAVVTTSYSGNETTVTDQAGKKRKSITDGLGRLAQVIEDPLGLGYLTSYGYDARGNLKTVTQGAQSRSFNYDALSRLTSATNPESGTVSYGYDANSNLISKTDARGITTNYVYDALNRVTSRSYVNDPSATAAVSYSYDAVGVPFSKGRLTSVSSTVSSYSYGEYDPLGRVKTGTQTTSGQSYSMSYGYDLAGNMTSETYPSGRTVTTAFDGGGRVSSVNGQKTGEANKTYASQFGYAAHGAVSAMALGNGLWEHTSFNSRLQPVQIGLGTSVADSSKLRLDYGYGTTNNNGNVLSQTITIGATVMSQSYAYDSLNRLSSASETGGWTQTYDYDRFGNRAVRNTSYIPQPQLTTQSAFAGDMSAFNASNNRLVASLYDAAGNQTSDAQTRTFAYDAENRQITFNGTAGQYFYDGDGRRVKKMDASGTTVFVCRIKRRYY
jgi:YD repeat-containing protein